MLIKATTAKGVAVPYSAQESLRFAVQYGAKAKNNSDYVYWLGSQKIEEETFQAHNDEKTGQWKEAFASGYAYIGKTRVSDDKFFIEKKVHFKVHYALSTDAIGLPDLKIVSFEMDQLETNPAKNVGAVVIEKNEALPIVSGDLVIEKTNSSVSVAKKQSK